MQPFPIGMAVFTMHSLFNQTKYFHKKKDMLLAFYEVVRQPICKSNLDTPFIMAVLSKGQGGTAKGCRDSKIRVQSPSISVGLKQPSCLLTSFQRCCFSAALLLFGQVWKTRRKPSWISSIQMPSPSSTQARWHHGPTTPTSQTRTRTKW